MIRSVYLVARRDYLGYVTAWGFWLGLLITPVLFGLGLFVPALIAASQPDRYFTVIDPEGAFEAAIDEELRQTALDIARLQVMAEGFADQNPDGALEAFDAAAEAGATPEDAVAAAGIDTGRTGFEVPASTYIRVPSPARSVDGLRPYLTGEQLIDTADGPKPLFAAIVVMDGTIEYWSESVTVGDLKATVRQASRKLAQSRVFEDQGVPETIVDDVQAATPELVERKFREDAAQATEVSFADQAPVIVSVIIAFMLWMLIFSVVNYLLMGTIEERSNKIFDSLLTAVKLPHLLAGKLIAVFAVSATLALFWGLGGTAVTLLGAATMPSEAVAQVGIAAAAALKPSIIVPALMSFVLGYVMFGAIFLALGSLCDTVQEAQTLMTPLLVLLMVPLFMVIVAINDPTSPVLVAMSWVPVFTPFLLILRMPAEPPLWEVIAQLGLMALTAVVILWLAARVYRAGAVNGAGVNDVAGWFKGLLPGRAKR